MNFNMKLHLSGSDIQSGKFLVKFSCAGCHPYQRLEVILMFY